MTGDILHELGELRGEFAAWRREQDRHIATAAETHREVVAIRLELAESRGHIGGILRHAITTAIAVVAGALGAHIPIGH